MDNPENLIYVILIVGSLIWQLAKKFIGKKEQTTQPKPAPTPQPKRTLEDIFREMAGEFEPQPIPQPVVVQPIAQPKPIMNDALAEKRIIVPKIIQQEEILQRNFAVDLENSNDWQRAFVYSEIFNRKY